MLVRRSTAKVDQIDSWDGEFVIRREMKQTVLIFRRMRGNLTEMYKTLKKNIMGQILFSQLCYLLLKAMRQRLGKKKFHPVFGFSGTHYPRG